MERSLAKLTKITNVYVFNSSSTTFTDILMKGTLYKVIHYKAYNGKEKKERKTFRCPSVGDWLNYGSPIERENKIQP